MAFRVLVMCVFILAMLSSGQQQAMGFESAKVLPKGVRNLNIRSARTDLSQKTDKAGDAQPLASALNRELTFKQISKGETLIRARSLEAFLTSNEFSMDESVGDFSADLQGHISVMAPVLAYGMTSRFTLAVAVPVYYAATSIAVGFVPNERAQAFLDTLSRPENNQSHAAREAGAKLNDAVGELNEKLAVNGYRELDDWEGQGLGDVTVAAKYQFLEIPYLHAASTGGVVLPTGRTDDPDILNDIPFGDGQADLFAQLSLDQPLGWGFTINEFYKYTHQLPGDKKLRAQTDDETIEVPYQRARFKLGDKIDTGASLVWEPSFGLIGGVGFQYHRKHGDIYREINGETKAIVEDGTDQEAQNVLTQLGYSTVPLYQRGAFAVPFSVKMTYSRQIESRNMPITDLAQFDLNLYF